MAAGAIAIVSSQCALLQAAVPPLEKLAEFTYAGDPKLPFQIQEYLRANVGQPEKYAVLAEAIRQLEPTLKSADPLSLACDVLATVGSAQDVKFLTAQLKNPAVFPSAKTALQNIGTAEAVQALLDFAPAASESQMESLLLTFGLLDVPATVPYTVSMTTSPDRLIRRAAFQALASNSAPEAFTALTQASPKTEDGSAAAMVEGARHSTDAEEAGQLCQKVIQTDALPLEVRAAAVRVMVRRQLPGVAELLAGLEKSADPAIAPILLENFHALSPAGQERLIKSVSGQIGQPEAVVRLSSIGDAFPPAELLPLAISAHAKLGEVALRLLSRTGTEAEFHKALDGFVTTPADDARHERWWNVLLFLPLSTEGWTIQALSAAPNTSKQIALIQLIQARRFSSGEDLLLASLESKDAGVRLAASQALAVVGAPEQTPRLAARLLATSDARERAPLVKALALSLRHSPQRQEIIAQLAGKLPSLEDAALKEQVITLLGATGTVEAQAALWKLFDSADLTQKKSIVRALAQWPNSSSLPQLTKIAAASDDESLRLLAARSYLDVVSRANDLPAEARVEKLSEAQKFATRPEERRLIIAQAAALKTASAKKLIESYRSDEALKAEVESALAPKTKSADKQKAEDKGVESTNLE